MSILLKWSHYFNLTHFENKEVICSSVCVCSPISPSMMYRFRKIFYLILNSVLLRWSHNCHFTDFKKEKILNSTVCIFFLRWSHNCHCHFSDDIQCGDRVIEGILHVLLDCVRKTQIYTF